ncbi:hypothetical protein C5167_026635 [Papaver somniferum]|nr:hypothetical protein C5167_026635 [Papaver somniferum]
MEPHEEDYHGSSDSVLWDPYHNHIHRNFFPIRNIVWYTGLIVCIGVLEPYYPERVLRQLGRCQRIPRSPICTHTVVGTREGSFVSVYSCAQDYWTSWQDKLLDYSQRSSSAQHPWHCSGDYIDWYSRVSRPRIQNPRHNGVRHTVTQRLFKRLTHNTPRSSP